MKEKDNSKELKSARGALRAEQAPGGLEGDNQSWFAGQVTDKVGVTQGLGGVCQCSLRLPVCLM